MRLRDVGDAGEELDQPCARGGVRLAASDRALLRRAVHEDAPAELGAEANECGSDFGGACAHARVGVGDRETGRLHEQPVQPRHDQAGRLDGAPDARDLGRSHAFGRLRERERCDLEAVVAERSGDLALPLERHVGEHLVAERELHETSPLRAGRPSAERTTAPALPVARRTADLNAGT